MFARSVVATVLALATGVQASADDVMRCGTAIVDVGMVAAQVVARCGEPLTREVESTPVRARGGKGAVKTVGSTRVERWTYDRGYGRLLALLTFERGKLKSIELLARP
jgi:hypothetical protein